jgi:hypothetical protein
VHHLADPDSSPARRRAESRRVRGAGDSIAVAWDRERTAPTAFVWRGRRWRVERIDRTWVVETGWWNDELRVDRYYSRVVAQGRIFDLCFDRSLKRWSIDRIVS